MSRYLINGDVADRGKHAVEILLVIFALMLAAPRTIHFNRGNHESLDMNVRSNPNPIPNPNPNPNIMLPATLLRGECASM